MTRTLSRYFPADHVRAGQPTYFVEKFLNAMHVPYWLAIYTNKLRELNPDKDPRMLYDFWNELGSFGTDSDYYLGEKKHTIRMNHHIKDGQMLQLSVWSGKPYNSPQIKIWEPVKVGAQSIKVDPPYKSDYEYNGPEKWFAASFWLINGKEGQPDGHILSHGVLAANDGLSLPGFQSWFRKSSGPAQIIHFTDLRY